MAETNIDNMNWKMAYWSDNDTPFDPQLVPSKFDWNSYGEHYPLVKASPDSSIQNPIYDWNGHSWVEMKSTALSARVSQQSKQIDQLSKDTKDNAKAIEQVNNQTENTNRQLTEVQKTVANSGQSTTLLAQQFNQFGTQISKALSQINTTMQKMNEKIDQNNGETKEN